MKIQIIPDIHTGVARAEMAIEQESADKVIFIGDYFDSFGDTLEETEQVAWWLKKSMENPNRIHLLGNHDLAYMDQNHICSGFSQGKLFAIKNTKIDLTKLQHYCWAGDWLCTHAGLSNDFYRAYTLCPSKIEDDENKNVENFLHGLSTDPEGKHRLYDCSVHRGGRNAYGGIVWCDYEEFNDIPNVKQIFGHTHDDEVRHRQTKNAEHYCIDTGLKHYGVLDTETNMMIIAEAKNA